MVETYVYPFRQGGHNTPGLAGQRIIHVLGNKGGRLAVMGNNNFPIPPGFTIPTTVCAYFYKNGKTFPDALRSQVDVAMSQVGEIVGRMFDDPQWPLLVSVRSGARASMPGMMDTILNVGLSKRLVGPLALRTNPRFAWDCRRRLLQMYGAVVLGVDKEDFDKIIDSRKEMRGVEKDVELDADDLQAIALEFEMLIVTQTGKPFPEDPKEQLWGAIEAVFGSWMNKRAKKYRRMKNISDAWGTAVTVQAMVFGNLGDDCYTGVAFSRNPSTGEDELYGEILCNAQGEDVVAGTRTPEPINVLRERAPHLYDEFKDYAKRLEAYYRNMQDMEFTVERGKLWMLQTRDGKRTARAALKIAKALATQKPIPLINECEALNMVEAESLEHLLHPTIDPRAKCDVLTLGMKASPGAATGKIVFDPDEAEKSSEKVILVRIETSPEDIGGMDKAEGILTTRGGMTSHAAVVARGMGKPCVCSAKNMRIDYEQQCFFVGDRRFNKGDYITIDGTDGRVIAGEVNMIEPVLGDDFNTMMGWADAKRRLSIRTNAETPRDARAARLFGAEGIGLARTEHMFFEKERIPVVRDMFLAENEKDERAALDKLLPMQRADFIELFKIMDGQPVNIRLLDAPLNEFLSADDPRSARLHEFNPMLGKRACRLALLHPAIYKMQTRAIIEAAIETGFSVNATEKPSLEIMVPLIAFQGELEQIVVQQIRETIREVLSEHPGIVLGIKIGTMIETPRAALRAGELAPLVDYLSFGTNDLTQTTAGFSRDDLSEVISRYIDLGIFATDIFVSLDQEGVGELIMIAATRARAANPNITLGVCGEHGGDPASIAFFDKLGFDYVSCSPYRVPTARLAAAQAAIGANSDQTK